MKLISESHERSGSSLVGGKGNHLQKLMKWGAPVPPFFVLTTDCYRYYMERGEIPDIVGQRFDRFFEKHKVIALRSSMVSEDQIDSSFAGLFETLLNVTRSNWKESLMQIYSSVKSTRVEEYIQKKNLQVELLMAVVAQELVEVEKSGVVFTRSPVTPTGALAIDAAFGMGEGVVSGHSDVDHYQLTRTGEVIEARSNNERPVLNNSELNELLRLSLKLEKKAGTPSDIEWGYKSEKLYLFQIRPITRSFEPLTYFVDTNLSESYPGTVSPFTASFVKKAYENVFRESAFIMGGQGKRLEDLTYHYARLISSVDNHLYYNLEHYYAALRALPGGERNIDNWHRMIGGKMEGHEIPSHPTAPSKLEMISTITSLVRLALRRNKIFRPFLSDLEATRTKIENDIGMLTGPKATIFYLNALVNRPLGFGLTVVNDVFIMIGLGFIIKALKKKGLSEEEVIDLLKTTEGVDSIRPLEHFNDLVQELDEKFIESFSKSDLRIGFEPYEEIFRNLEINGWGEQVKKVKAFIQLYGDRSFEELKLESLPIRNNPLLLKQLILWARKNASVHKSGIQNEGPKISLSWLEKRLLAFTRESIAVREATRLWRGKFYHLLRQLVLNLGVQLRKEDRSWESFSTLDYFSLSHQEWLEYAQGKLSAGQVQDLMNIRRNWQEKKKNYPEIIPWVENEPLPELHVFHDKSGLGGQGVSPGTAEGRALVLESPDEALNSDLKDFILVTKNTDPAWVYIMSRSQGLISEKGSLLSHTAIIGRELNVPTIVGVKSATQKIKTGDRLRIDATKGTIEIL